MKLVSLVQDRTERVETTNLDVSIQIDELGDITELSEHFKDANEEEVVKTIKGELKVSNNFVRNVCSRSKKLLDMINTITESAKSEKSQEETLEGMFLEKGTIIILNLDNAVTVLRNISQDPQSQPMFKMAVVSSMVAKNVQAYLSQHHPSVSPLANVPPLGSGGKGRKIHGGKGGNRGYGKGRSIEAGNNRKRRLADWVPNDDDYCLDCGSKDHRWSEK